MTRFTSLAVYIFAAIALPISISAGPPTATTVGGRVIQCSVKEKAPWADDVLKHELPEYPYEARSRLQEGNGWFQMHLRSDGTVESVKILKSVGYSALDQAAIAAL